MEGLRGYWMRKQYKRLDGSGRPSNQKKTSRVELGRTRRKRFWRIRISPKLRMLRFGSPKKLLIRMRDAYVKMMLGFANSGALGGGYGYGYGAGTDSRVMDFGRPQVKEYDEKVIVEIYKSLVAQRQLMIEGGKVGEVACAR